MCMKVNEGEWREVNVYELMQISIGQRVTALRLGAIPVINGQSSIGSTLTMPKLHLATFVTLSSDLGVALNGLILIKLL